MDVKVLKSFVSAHDAVNWVSQNRIDDTAIETTGTLKSMGMGPVPSGNYHVVLKGKRLFKFLDRLGSQPQVDRATAEAILQRDAENRRGQTFLSDAASDMASGIIDTVTGGRISPTPSRRRDIDLPGSAANKVPSPKNYNRGDIKVRPENIKDQDAPFDERGTSIPGVGYGETAAAAQDRADNRGLIGSTPTDEERSAASEETGQKLMRDNLHPGEARRLLRELTGPKEEKMASVITKAIMDALKSLDS